MRIPFFIASLFLFPSLCKAQLILPKVFGDSMVLQRGIAIPVWGTASAGSQITGQLGAVHVTAKADNNGKWMLRFPTFTAGGPYTLKITERGKAATAIELKGILIGDVWVASGQSNMEMEVQGAGDARREIENARYPPIRFLVVAHGTRFSPQSDIPAGKWKVCDTGSVKKFSAVAYYFARKLHGDQHVPVGIIQSTWGGTPVEAWTSREMLLTSPITKAKTLSNDTLGFHQEDLVTDSLNWVRIWDLVYNPQHNADKIFPAVQYNDADWTPIEMPKVLKDFGIGNYEGMVWLRKKIALPGSLAGKALIIDLGHPEMNYSLYFNGQEICKNIWNSNPTHSFTIPAGLVKSGENTIAVRVAMLWGGGGLNLPADDLYITDGLSKISLAGKWLYKKDLETAFPKMRNYQYYPNVLFDAMINPLIPFGIKGFIWYQGESNAWAAYDYRTLFPMLIKDWRQRWQQGDVPFLFVQLANFMKTKPLPGESEWAELREAQTMTLSLPNTGMACSIDIGEGNDIHPKNKQEVGRRVALVANKLVYKRNVIASGPMYKNFQRQGNRIRINFTNTGARLSTKDGKEVTGFAIAGNDHIFYWAKAIIGGDHVIVSADSVPEPVAVRYAWADNPDCNLVNSAKLPAVPFRTDAWKGITQHQVQEVAKLESPDRSIILSVSLSASGEIQYELQKAGISVIEPSALGVTMKGHHFAQRMKLATVTAPEIIQDSYQLKNGKKSSIRYQANQLTVSFVNEETKKMDVIFRLSNDGLAFRYFFPWVNGEQQVIEQEATSFHFSKKARAWLQPMMAAKEGWCKTAPSYEEHYSQDLAVGAMPPAHAGWVFPALFKTNGVWALITEAAVDEHYCASRLLNDSLSPVYSIGMPDPREVFTGGGYLPVNDQPWYTPWRIIAVGSLKTIVASTLGTDLAPAAVLKDTSFIKPGKASWSWINSKDDNLNFNEQKKYIDFASDMHWQYCLIDADWDTKIGYDSIQVLSKYAAQKKVGLLLWYNSAGDWNTVAYHPKNKLLTHEDRTKEFSRLTEMGIKGIKVDFFGGDGQSMMKYYLDILKDAAAYKLLVNFHGATLPRGWQRTYPNLMTAEAIYGMEMVTFVQDAADKQASHCAMLPFTRNAFDPMDFTPMNLTGLTSSNCIRKTTPAFELALSVLFISGIQHYAQAPEGMVKVPGYVKDFLRTLPNNWDDVQLLDGYPGQYVVIARRSGNRWYISGINGTVTEKKISLDLSSFKKSKAALFTDGTKGELFSRTILSTAVQKKCALTLHANGGFVMVLE